MISLINSVRARSRNSARRLLVRRRTESLPARAWLAMKSTPSPLPIQPMAAPKLCPATVIEKVVEEVSFEGPDLPQKKVTIDGPFVRSKLGPIMQREDLSRFIL